MDEAAYRKWATTLPDLSQTQLSDLAMRIKLLSRDAPPKPGKSDFNERMLANIVFVFRRLGVEAPSVSVLRKSSAYTIGKDKLADLKTFIDGVTDQKVTQDGILRTGIELLYFDLVKMKDMTVSSHTILRHLHRIPATLNRHFPGYAVGGVLAKIVKTE